MGNRYMHMEDNGDGTITMKLKLSDEEETFIFPLDFDDIVKGLDIEEVINAANQGVHIPNTLPEEV